MITGFPPIEHHSAKILILGSMPSVKSIEKGEYYGNKSNDFWPIISRLYKAEFYTYQDKIDTAIANHIAIWDVFASCSREQSKDHTIKDEIINDFFSFFLHHPDIHTIIAHGKKAYQAILTCKDSIPPIPIHLAVSTSRAYPLAFEKKVAIWKELLT